MGQQSKNTDSRKWMKLYPTTNEKEVTYDLAAPFFSAYSQRSRNEGDSESIEGSIAHTLNPSASNKDSGISIALS